MKGHQLQSGQDHSSPCTAWQAGCTKAGVPVQWLQGRRAGWAQLQPQGRSRHNRLCGRGKLNFRQTDNRHLLDIYLVDDTDLSVQTLYVQMCIGCHHRFRPCPAHAWPSLMTMHVRHMHGHVMLICRECISPSAALIISACSRAMFPSSSAFVASTLHRAVKGGQETPRRSIKGTLAEKVAGKCENKAVTTRRSVSLLVSMISAASQGKKPSQLGLPGSPSSSWAL